MADLTLPTPDTVAKALKRSRRRHATVFNIRGNNHRHITAIHYNTGTVFVLRFPTHAESTGTRGRTRYEHNHRQPRVRG